jgi:hypothetical protein
MILNRHSSFKFPIKLQADKTIQSFIFQLISYQDFLDIDLYSFSFRS